MSFNGSGTFQINTTGQPVVSGTVISSTAFNALTADLATGLSTCITKDGQTTPTANIPMGNNKITGLAVGSAATDSANLSQVQSTVVKLLTSVTGTDTITAAGSPSVAAYAAGQMFYFVATGDNTGAVTLNIDSLGAKSITRDGAVALVAGDIKSGEVVVVVYDGTRFQMVSPSNSAGDVRFANVSIASALYVGGVATVVGNTGFSANVSIASALSIGGVAAITGTTSSAKFIPTGGTATGNGMYLSTTNTLGFSTNGTLRASMDASGNLLVGTTVAPGANGAGIAIYKSDYPRLTFRNSSTGDTTSDGTRLLLENSDFLIANAENAAITFQTQSLERARITGAGDVGIGTTTPATKFEVSGTTRSSAFQTTSGTVSVAPSTATTFFTPSDSGLYLARIYLPGNASQTWDAVIIFTFNATNILIVNQTNGANVSTSVSGTDVKVTQIGAGTFTFTYDVMRIG
jgi:hypothetical protein